MESMSQFFAGPSDYIALFMTFDRWQTPALFFFEKIWIPKGSIVDSNLHFAAMKKHMFLNFRMFMMVSLPLSQRRRNFLLHIIVRFL